MAAIARPDGGMALTIGPRPSNLSSMSTPSTAASARQSMCMCMCLCRARVAVHGG
jgi:hypothetical protein